ncbi:MAG: hypothetical protein P4L22_07760 [Candidatus Babeliales bacterium]|nr:hypothetical protein [Candidatus Babeliales bacterium]
MLKVLLPVILLGFNVFSNTIYFINQTEIPDEKINIMWGSGEEWKTIKLSDYVIYEMGVKKLKVKVPENIEDFTVTANLDDNFIKSETVKIHNDYKYFLSLKIHSKHCVIAVFSKNTSPKNSLEFQAHQNNFNE